MRFNGRCLASRLTGLCLIAVAALCLATSSARAQTLPASPLDAQRGDPGDRRPSGELQCPDGPVGDPGLQGPPAAIGQWAPTMEWETKAIHLNLMPDGKVLYWEAGEILGVPPTMTYLWNPADDTHKAIPTPGLELFCAGHVYLPDGRLFATGGTRGEVGNGAEHAAIFDPATESWTRVADMHHGRYYPTALSLGDGRVFVISGTGADPDYDDPVQIGAPEIYDPVTDTFELRQQNYLQLAFYPRSFLIPDGRIVVVGPHSPTFTLDMAIDNWSITDWLGRVTGDGGATMLGPGELMVSGGASPPGQGDPATALTSVLDMNDEEPLWRDLPDATYARTWNDMLRLPDGSVMSVGGGYQSGWDPECAVLAPELFDPVSESWKTVASHERSREYHGTALLLPDGRVLVAGGENSEIGGEDNAEIFSPPYLFHGPRPTIFSSPSHVTYGGDFLVRTPHAASIESVALMRPGSVTHAFTSSQPAYLSLEFSAGLKSLSVTAPATGNLAPPGPYMLFLVDSAGVPSVSEFVSLGSCASTESLEFSCADGVDNDCDGLIDGGDLDCGPQTLPFAPAGAVPNGVIDSRRLTLAKGAQGLMTLDWAASCDESDTDYAIYEGKIGEFGTHVPVFCSTNGATTRSFDRHGSNYYLVVPNNGVREGSYGIDSDGAPRSIAVGSCLPQEVAECFRSASARRIPG